jgi:hypothetical protein
MQKTIDIAAREYANRPPDERYASPQAMLQAAEHDRQYSKEITYNTRDLSVVPANTHNTPTFGATPEQSTLRLQSPKGTAAFTHWSFGQLCRMLGAPASYLRDLPPAIAADALNFGLHEAIGHATDAKLLVKANGTAPIVRACTSETYGRAWDAHLYGETLRVLPAPTWDIPPTWDGKPAGAYRGDRDSFLILVNGGSIVTDPSLRGRAVQTGPNGDGGAAMYRGIMLRNSEVGACSIWIDLIFFRYICGNHMLWGAMFDQRFKRRHVGQHGPNVRPFTTALVQHLRDIGEPTAAAVLADLARTAETLAGLKLIGFAIWERRGAAKHYVTFPARQYAVNGERRSFALLRPIIDTTGQERIRDLILEAYAQHDGQGDDDARTFGRSDVCSKADVQF